MKLWLFVAAAGLAVSGCAGSRLVGGRDVTVVSSAELPPPTRADATAQQRPYLIGPFDGLSVDVFGVPEATREVQVDASGRIALPLAGEVQAGGKTAAELAALITEQLRGMIRDPQVTVNITQTVSQVITVDGSVTEPGQYPVVGRLTLMRAIARAKGLTEFGRERHVVVFRQVNGQQMAALYDLRSIREGIYPDPEVYAADVVYVGDSQARRLFRDLVTSGGLLMTPIVALLQR